MKFHWQMVENFYTTPFMELFLQPRQKFNLPAAVNAVLAGELEGGWAVRWRMRVFFFLVRLQGRFPLVPRISFANGASPEKERMASSVPRPEPAKVIR
jgi:FADH2-dependent halogenase